ncbi:MAG: DUF4235 domain-containing protein [Nocardioidaceae bacterium]|nr:DUF4235 domain-containing protein [Nocardioidaceae bacterium]
MARRTKDQLIEQSDEPIKTAVAVGAKPTTKKGGKRLWKVYSKGSTLLAGVIALRLTETTWQLATHRKAPNDPEHPDINAREAITWALLSGVTAELTKILISRKTAQYWVRSTGNLPPGMDPLED